LLLYGATWTGDFRGLRKSSSNSPELKHLAARSSLELFRAMDSLLLLPVCASAQFERALLAQL